MSTDPRVNSIIHPGFFEYSELVGTCPHGLRNFALTLVAVRPDRVAKEIRVFECRHCRREVAFPRGLPDRVLG